jgi:FkbM family methyltransferase
MRVKKVIKEWLKRAIPRGLVEFVYPWTQRGLAKENGLGISVDESFVTISRDRDRILLSRRHPAYIADVLRGFDYYFQAVSPAVVGDLRVIDCSAPKCHAVVGYTTMPVMFASLAEPIVTAQQYVEFAGLRRGHVVLDLGAYSGLTAMVFAEAVGPGGGVVALEADPKNFETCEYNICRFNALTAKSGAARVELMFAAAWSDCDGILLSSEGSMGSGFDGILGSARGDLVRVPSRTLTEIAGMHGLERVDFVKCDIEGAEVEVFKDQEFLHKFRPRIIVETHEVGGDDSGRLVVAQLERLGYACTRAGSQRHDPWLLECVPTGTEGFA